MRKFVVAASRRSQMQRRKKITASSEYHRGDIIEFDGNARGINPRIGQARILNIRPGMASHGYTNPDPVYDVEDVESGRRFTIDHFQIQGVVGSAIMSADDESEFDLPQVSQKFSSKKTAVNGRQGKLPAIFKLIPWSSGTINLDYGGGTEDAQSVADAYFEDKGVTNLIYDVYNQTAQHNREVVKKIRANGGADTCTLSNVLNVIAEPESRMNVLQNIQKLLKSNGTLYITVYEGTKTNRGQGKQTGQDQFQTNMALADYLEEVQQVFPNAKRKGKMIIAPNGGSVSASTRNKRRFKVTASTSRGVNLQEAYEIAKRTLPDEVGGVYSISGPNKEIPFDHFLIIQSDVGTLDVYVENGMIKIETYPEFTLCASCKNITEFRQYINRMIGSYHQTQDEYEGRYSANASTRVNAAYDVPERPLEPPAYDEPSEVSDSQEQVEFEFDCDILLSEDSWDYADQSYDFAAGNGSRGDWYGAETGVYLGDKTSMVEYLDELLESRLPSKPGMYHISGIANLIFDISGIYMYSDFQGRDEDDSPIIDETYDTDSADADFNFGASYIDRFRCEFVGEV